VLVEGLPGLPSDAVFFLNLSRWDDDENGLAVQVNLLGDYVRISYRESSVRGTCFH